MADATLGLESYEPAGAALLPERERLASPAAAVEIETDAANAAGVETEPPLVPFAPPAVDRGKTRLRSRAIAINPFGITQADLRRYLVSGVVFLMFAYFLSQVAFILPPFLIAFFLAALLDPTLRYYERRGLSRVRAILLIYALSLTALVAIGFLVVPSVAGELEDISAHFVPYTAAVQKNADAFLLKNEKTLQRFGVKQKRLSDLMDEKSGPVRSALNGFLAGLTDFITGLASKLLWLVVIPVAGFFLMRDYPLIRARFIATFPDAYHDRIDFISREITDVFSAYLRGLAKICSLFAVAACVLFWALGIENWLLLGLLGGMFYAVPYVGQLGTSTVVGAVCYSMPAHNAAGFLRVADHSPGYVAGVILCIIGLGIIFDQIIYPRVVGGSVGLHPVISIFAITVGATLFGVPGVLLAVPVAASIQVVLMCSFPRLSERPPARLLEPQPPMA